VKKGHEKKVKDEMELKKIEHKWEGLYFQDLVIFSNEEHRGYINGMEKRREHCQMKKRLFGNLRVDPFG
jgi:hypothetical protein